MTDLKLTDHEKKTIDILRVFAILSVITAHVSSIPGGTFIRDVLSAGYHIWSDVGVVLFLLIGGFLYHREKNDTKRYWSKRVKTLIIPWLVCSGLTYGLSCLLNGIQGIQNYFNWIFGIGSWYYYITIYFIILASFKFIYRSNAAMFLCIILNFVSLLLSSSGIIQYNIITPYLNVFNWCGYFAIGVLIRRYWNKIKSNTHHHMPLCATIASLIIAILFFIIYKEKAFGYFHIETAIITLCTSFFVILIAAKLSDTPLANYLVLLGQNTYFIYLIHMPLLQPIANRTPKILVFDIFDPLICFSIMIIFLLIVQVICNFIPLLKKAKWIIGLR